MVSALTRSGFLRVDRVQSRILALSELSVGLSVATSSVCQMHSSYTFSGGPPSCTSTMCNFLNPEPYTRLKSELV